MNDDFLSLQAFQRQSLSESEWTSLLWSPLFYAIYIISWMLKKNAALSFSSYFLLPFCHLLTWKWDVRKKKVKNKRKKKISCVRVEQQLHKNSIPTPFCTSESLRQDRSADVICYAKHCYYPFLATTTTHQTMIVKMMIIWMLWIQKQDTDAHNKYT